MIGDDIVYEVNYATTTRMSNCKIFSLLAMVVAMWLNLFCEKNCQNSLQFFWDNEILH